ncbi:MAG: RHS repeat-associated core domain-containing protein, partial [Gemmatimonadaceae bacterium]|nr:RHS repeat-associated core domain-containing protein [Gemmatimonadaceae bacterium]
WGAAGGALDLKAVKDPSNFYTTKEFNANGLPTKIVYGDNDSNPATGGQRVLFVGYDATFPGRVATTTRQREFAGGDVCLSGYAGDPCTVSTSTYTTDGKLDAVQKVVNTLDSSGNTAELTYTTDYSYDTKGRLTQINGPLSGSDDVTIFEYWNTPSDPLTHGFVQNFKRKKDATNFVTQSSLAFDFWGNPTAITDADGTVSCQFFSAERGYLAQRREQMAGQTDCTPDAADLVTTYARDTALRLTYHRRPDGSCMFYEYDARGRLSKTKRRDDCFEPSGGDRQEYTYSDDGLLTKIETFDAGGAVSKRQELTYFDSRRLEKIINPVNTAKWTGLTYEARGLLDNVVAADGSSNLSKTQWGYNADGRVTSEKRYTAGTSFDTWNLLFDWIGNQQQVIDGDSKVTTSMRDDLGRVVKLTSPDLGGFPTLRVFDAASRLTTVKETFGGAGVRTHTFTFDYLGRPLDDDYHGTCTNTATGAQVNVPDIVRYYDTLAGRSTCPSGTSCSNLGGRLAHVKVKLMCTTVAGPDADYTLEQETWFGYDAAGRLTHEYIKDDNGRTAAHVYAWTKNGALQQVTLPSTTVLGASFDSTGGNSDADKITALWRTNTSSPIIDNVLYQPYGPVRQYNQMNTTTGIGPQGALRTKIDHNLAYRHVNNFVRKEPNAGDNNRLEVSTQEDAQGRVTWRGYFPTTGLDWPGQRKHSWFLYDMQNRVICETATYGATSCPTSGSALKNNHSATPPFTAAGDWKTLLRPIPGSTGVVHNFALYTGTHQISTVTQSDGTPTLGDTIVSYDSRGNRNIDDNQSGLTNDIRTYTYDDRRNVTNVRGQYKTAGTWRFYNVGSAFDAKNRRVFKSFYDETTLKTATWFFYYDPYDRLVEVRHTPDASASATYSLFQLVWLGDKLVLYWQTDYPSVTTSKRYVQTDESQRPVAMMSWPASGDAVHLWNINSDAWGNDTIQVDPGNSFFQPILFAGQYKDDETIAWQNDGSTRHRPGLVLNGFRTYDPWTGSYLQVDPLVDSTWSSYVYVDSNPVGKTDRDGLMTFMSGECVGDNWETMTLGEVASCVAGPSP